MIYKKYSPPNRFSAFVECLFSWVGNADKMLEIETPPSAFSSIVFNYCAPYYISNHKYPHLQLPAAFLAGQAIRNYSLHLNGKIGMVGIVFKPAGLFQFLGIPMYKFTEERIDLLAILPEAAKYVEQIESSSSMSDRINVLNSFLEFLFNNGNFADPQIVQASNLILEEKGNISINDLMTNVHLSRRQFERNFLDHVGVSPKTYGKLRRFGYTCSIIAGKRKINLTSVLYECGYYDQSHFIKDFKYFAGRTPKFYMENSIELAHLIEKHELVRDSES